MSHAPRITFLACVLLAFTSGVLFAGRPYVILVSKTDLSKQNFS